MEAHYSTGSYKTENRLREVAGKPCQAENKSEATENGIAGRKEKNKILEVTFSITERK